MFTLINLIRPKARNVNKTLCDTDPNLKLSPTPKGNRIDNAFELPDKSDPNDELLNPELKEYYERVRGDITK